MLHGREHRKDAVEHRGGGEEVEEELEQLGGDYEDGKEKREWRRRGKSRWARVAALDTWGFYTGGERTTTVPSTNMRRGHAEIVAVRKEEGRGRLLASQKLKRPRCCCWPQRKTGVGCSEMLAKWPEGGSGLASERKKCQIGSMLGYCLFCYFLEFCKMQGKTKRRKRIGA
jgi:hypothetical protein